MKNKGIIIAILIIISIGIFSVSSCTEINTVGDSHFTSDGYYVQDSDSVKTFDITLPSKIKYYVEVSGSMNGFFRPNRPTHFKADVWEIMSYMSEIPSEIVILTNNGDTGAKIPFGQFQTMMNTGAFVSSASTQVPTMLRSITNDIKPNAGEVAVLISDMKYSPVGAAAPDVLLSQYSTDVSRILGSFQKPVCLIGATSNYLDKSGISVVDKSPYYFFIIGNEGPVAYLRNVISTLVDKRKHFIDNIESGFNYGTPTYSFGIPDNCYQYEDQPTFVDYDESSSDTCVVNLKVNLEKYRWIMEDTTYFKNAFKCEALYGSNIKIGDVKIHAEHITDKELIRTAVATIELKVYNMALDSEVIKWTLELPDTDYTKFAPYVCDVESENDLNKSFSVLNFMEGIFYGGVVNKTIKPNYILISKNS